MDKTLQDKAIDIKGKKYVQVKDRVAYLSENYEGKYSIDTTYKYLPDQRLWIVKAVLSINGCTYSGLAQEVESDDYRAVNNASALENCETSAIGRACAAFGLGIQESYASANEMNKQPRQIKYATEKQIKWLRDTAFEVNDQLSDDPKDKDFMYVDDWIESILTIKPEQVPIFKVKDAVDKLKEVKTVTPEVDLDSIEVTEQNLEDLHNDNLPY